MKCCYCGQEVREGQKYCANCGTPVNVDDHSSGDNWNCGNMEDQSSENNWSQPNMEDHSFGYNSSPSKKKLKKILKYLGVLVAVFLIGSVAVGISCEIHSSYKLKELAEQKKVLIEELRKEFTFPENDESNAITRVLQGEWWDAEDLNQNSEYPTRFTFQGSDGCTYHGGSIMTSNFSIGGNYVIDTESRKIYFIKETLQEKLDAIDEAADLTEVEFDINFYIDNCVEDIIYEIDENGYLILYYEGSRLIKE